MARRSRVPPDGLPLAYEVMPRLDHGPRDRDEAVLAEMRAVLDKMATIQMVDVNLHQHPPRVGRDRPLKDDHPSPDITF